MGWRTMPSNVVETAFERQIKEGKGYQISDRFVIPANSSIWFFVQVPSNRDLVLQSRNIGCSSGYVLHSVYRNANLVGSLGDAIIPEALSDYSRPPTVQVNWVDAASLDITGIPATDKYIVPSSVYLDGSGVDGAIFPNFFKIYKHATTFAVKLENISGVSAQGELFCLWAEDTE